jgi:hypothetical protein
VHPQFLGSDSIPMQCIKIVLGQYMQYQLFYQTDLLQLDQLLGWGEQMCLVFLFAISYWSFLIRSDVEK